MTEEEFLKSYSIEKFDRPSVATDMAVFSIDEKEDSDMNYRKENKSVLKLLLIKRDEYPYKDSWALPGGFLRKDETPNAAAFRELKEETGVDVAFLRTLDVFGTPGRDPRGWIISHAYLALVENSKCKVVAGSDAENADWFEIKVKIEKEQSENDGNTISRETVYSLELNNGGDVKLLSLIKRKTTYRDFHEISEYSEVDSFGFAFDHAIIILRAYLELQDMAEKDGRIIFDLLPEYFTLYKLQKAFEIVLGKELLVANFRRKISDFVTETDKIDAGSGHRPAKLFTRNLDKF
ncbi:MAG: NUDIX hydrolase [Lachnospiraceae bacterium]|nr:NUDIX hydrolase [Lachnospiraceae bacterium]